eukprot:CAMPEP_0197388698 /NCGR_PEP_ID=MMETSP1165-20131217/1214_1 /TAXON_ID=284809 /ORGANISM="Chrysocystis fragilis, Strain CCMP3189" /LENGTH=417 /DNA_ID=CAMNT_0042914049 /DNA_START=325 /DNA_END=1574 /DNA_ORIENTATION=-
MTEVVSDRRETDKGGVIHLAAFLTVDVVVLWAPDLDAVVEADAVRVALVPKLDDLSALEALLDVGQDGVANLEAELVVDFAGKEALLEFVVVEVAADEDEATLAGLAFLPGVVAVEAALEEHVDALEDELVVHADDGEEALVPKEVLALGDEDAVDEGLEAVDVDLALELEADGGDGRVVLVLAVGVEKLGVHRDDALEREGLDAEEELWVDLRLLRAVDGCLAVDGLDLLLDLAQDGLVDQVDLVEENAVREGDLLDRLVLDALGLDLVEVLHRVGRVDYGHDAVEPVQDLDVVVDEEGLGDRGRVGKARRLDDNCVELREPLAPEILQDLDQVAPHRAAHASVHHLHDLVLAALLQNAVVDSHLAELVLDHGEFEPMSRRLEDVVQERRLPRSEEPRHDCHRHPAIHLSHSFVRT